jgi:hypothetical protein
MSLLMTEKPKTETWSPTPLLDPKSLNLFFSPKDRLRLTVGAEYSYPTVKPAWASPLNYPGRYLSLLNGKGEEIVLIADPHDLHPAARDAVMEEVARRYLTSIIVRVLDARSEFGATYWHVETDRGFRDFVTQSLQENAQWLSPKHLMLIDVDGNRFELVDVTALDDGSRKHLTAIL